MKVVPGPAVARGAVTYRFSLSFPAGGDVVGMESKRTRANSRVGASEANATCNNADFVADALRTEWATPAGITILSNGPSSYSRPSAPAIAFPVSTVMDSLTGCV